MLNYHLEWECASALIRLNVSGLETQQLESEFRCLRYYPSYITQFLISNIVLHTYIHDTVKYYLILKCERPSILAKCNHLLLIRLKWITKINKMVLCRGQKNQKIKLLLLVDVCPCRGQYQIDHAS